MFVATVTAPLRPGLGDDRSLHFSWFFAFSTLCGTPRWFRTFERISDFSIETVPTRTGWPFAFRSMMSSATAFHFASSLL